MTQTPRYGVPETLMPGMRRIIAPNPSPMTYHGTNTYVVGTKDCAVIDPGPLHEGHLHAILNALSTDQHISHIIVTHAHQDHSPLARPLAEATSAPVLAFGPAQAGRSAAMQALVEAGFSSGGEGIDAAFSPDQTIADGATVRGSDWTLEVLHTPGHLGNHISLACGDICFTGDHVMGWASSLVSPPDGDLTDFMASCEKLRTRAWTRFLPGHGAPVDDPHARLDWLIDHRRQREAAILAQLRHGPATVAQLAHAIYTDTPNALLPAAERNVLAHLIDLYGKSRIFPIGALHPDTQFQLT